MVFLIIGFFALVFRLVLVAGVIVDDTSDLIVYSNNPPWQAGSSSQTASAITSPGSSYGGTWHQALAYRTSFTFTFTGTSVAVYGIVPKYQETQLGFTIDAGTETLFDSKATEDLVTTQWVRNYNYSVQVFKNDGLNAGTHTLSMLCHLGSCTFGLDYIEYTAADVAATTAIIGTQSLSIGTQSLSQATTSTGTQTTVVTTSAVTNQTNTLPPLSMSIGESGTYGLPTTLPSNSQVTGSSTSQGTPNTAAVAGGVIGGAAVLALLIFGIYLSIRRQRRNGSSRPVTLMSEEVPPVMVPYEPPVIHLSEKQRIIAAERESQRAATLAALHPGPVVYQSFTKPMLPRMAHSPSYGGNGENSNIAPSNSTVDLSPHEQEIVATYFPAPAPLQYQHGRVADEQSFESSYDYLVPPTHSMGASGDPQASGTSHEGVWPASSPPNVEDVLARQDARNLSENDVDMVARRLAEVMRIQNTARGGPGLLRERTAPPDLGSREDTN